MPTQVQLRRGTTAQTAVFTGAAGEVTVNTDENYLVLHDGDTAGGHPVAPLVFAQAAFNTANLAFSGETAGIQRANAAFDKANAAFEKANTINLSSLSNSGYYANLNSDGTITLPIAGVSGVNARLQSPTGNVQINAGGAIFTFANNNTLIYPDGSVQTVAYPTGTLEFAQSAFDEANTAYGAAANAYSFTTLVNNKATAAFAQANAAFASANNVAPQVQPAFNTANSASIYANGAFIQANAAFAVANAALTAAMDTSYDQVIFDTANTAYSRANAGFSQANAAFNTSNSSYSQANIAFTQANVAFDQANVAFNTSNAAFSQANISFSQANAAFGQANAAFVVANGAVQTGSNAILTSVVSNTYIAMPYATTTGSVAYANTAGANTLVDQFDTSYFRSAKYQVQIENDSDFQASELLVLHTNIDVLLTEYSVICSNSSIDSLGTFYVSLDGTLAKLYYNPVQANNIVITHKTGLAQMKNGTSIPPDLISGTGTIDLTTGSGIIDLL